MSPNNLRFDKFPAPSSRNEKGDWFYRKSCTTGFFGPFPACSAALSLSRGIRSKSAYRHSRISHRFALDHTTGKAAAFLLSQLLPEQAFETG